MFTANDVVKAYEVTGLKPIYGSFFSQDYTCACALSALYAAKKNPGNPQEALAELRIQGDNFSEELINTIGISVEDANVFINDFYVGYDNKGSSYLSDNKCFTFGKEIRLEVEELLGVELKTTFDLPL